jgi:hypothetical protein
MISRRSFLTHLLAATVLVPFIGAGDADAAGSAKRRGKSLAKGRRKGSGKRYAARTRTRNRKYASTRRQRRPVSRPVYVRAPRSRLEEGWPFGWMDPRWSLGSGDPFFDPRWN